MNVELVLLAGALLLAAGLWALNRDPPDDDPGPPDDYCA